MNLIVVWIVSWKLLLGDQVGTVIESASEFYTGRLTKKERKASVADELLSDANLADYRYGRKTSLSMPSYVLHPHSSSGWLLCYIYVKYAYKSCCSNKLILSLKEHANGLNEERKTHVIPHVAQLNSVD